jgi:hypothetical protein
MLAVAGSPTSILASPGSEAPADDAVAAEGMATLADAPAPPELESDGAEHGDRSRHSGSHRWGHSERSGHWGHRSFEEGDDDAEPALEPGAVPPAPGGLPGDPSSPAPTDAPAEPEPTEVIDPTLPPSTPPMLDGSDLAGGDMGDGPRSDAVAPAAVPSSPENPSEVAAAVATDPPASAPAPAAAAPAPEPVAAVRRAPSHARAGVSIVRRPPAAFVRLSTVLPATAPPTTRIGRPAASAAPPTRSAPRRHRSSLVVGVTGVGKAAAAASRSPWLPIGLFAMALLYILGQRAMDRGSKLAYAGRTGEPDDELIEL